MFIRLSDGATFDPCKAIEQGLIRKPFSNWDTNTPQALDRWLDESYGLLRRRFLVAAPPGVPVESAKPKKLLRVINLDADE